MRSALSFIALFSLSFTFTFACNGGKTGSAPDSSASDSADTVDSGGFDTSTNGSCSTGSEWTDGNQGSSRMHPGRDCIDCHSGGEGPRFALAGTVQGAIHDPDDCNGIKDVIVHVTDGNGDVTDLTTNSAGNFFIEGGRLATPYTIAIEYGGQTRVMEGAQTDGACASCHTVDGTDGAPGRIVVPD